MTDKQIAERNAALKRYAQSRNAVNSTEYTYSRHWAPDDFRRNYTFTVWGSGVTCRLEHAGRSIHWQGDEAAEITDLVFNGGNAMLPGLWDEYEHISEED